MTKILFRRNNIAEELSRMLLGISQKKKSFNSAFFLTGKQGRRYGIEPAQQENECRH